jgi:phosphatidylglycerophosphate synthase
MKYTPRYFQKGMPKWKRVKDPILTRIFYRPLSFIISSLFTFYHVSANAVSIFSVFVGIIGAVFFIFGNYNLAIIGAILVNIWLLLDCCDGNIARNVKKQAYGEFFDGLSSYVLVAILFSCIGIYTYNNGGVIFSNSSIIVVILGFSASISDSLMRLVYQKYTNVSNELEKLSVIKSNVDVRTDISQVKKFQVRIEAELGIGGILPAVILLSVLFNFTDLILIYASLYYGGAMVFNILKYMYNANKYRNIIIK